MKHFTLSNPKLRTLVIVLWALSALCGFAGMALRLEHLPYRFLLQWSLIAYGLAWIIVLSDMLTRRVNNRFFWIFSMFLFVFMTPWVYFLRRRA